MTQEISDPIVTLYIFKRRGHPVALAIGHYPPDPGPLRYDSLLRIPIMANGDQPSWRAFEHRQNESIAHAMARAQIEPTTPARKHRRPPRRPAKSVSVEEEIAPMQPAIESHFTILGSSSDGRVFVRDRRTRQIVRLDPEEVTRV